MEIKDIIQLSKKIGYTLSPSQATEALFFAKGDVDKFKTPFTEADLNKFIKWFYDNRDILRLNKLNYMKNSRKMNNNSVTVRPSIHMINTTSLDAPRLKVTPGSGAFSPNQTTSRFAPTSPVNDVHMRSKLQVCTQNVSISIII